MTASLQVRQVIDVLRRGDRPRAVQLTVLSDLARADAVALSEAWPSLAEPARRDLVVRAVELAEDNVDLDFTQLAQVALGDDSAEIRQRAIDALWESRDRGVASQFATVLSGDPVETVRAAAASALEPFVVAFELGELKAEDGDRVIAALRSAATNAAESLDVRARALESLGGHAQSWVESMIIEAYDADDERMRIAAVRAMGLSAQEHWLEYLDDLVTSEEPLMRFEAAGAMGAIGSEDSVDGLAGLLNDEDVDVALAAIRALGVVGSDDALAKLRELVDLGDGELTEAAEAAIEAALYLEDPDLLASRIGL